MSLVFAITLFVNAALLFIIEPMVAKMILPFLGGSPAVWNTSLMFYQVCLLAGYAYAHFGATRLGTRRHAVLHLALAFVALSFLPVALPVHWLTKPTLEPVSRVLEVLVVSIGFPFLILSASAPLMQKWFAEGAHSAAHDPYFLYAASNAGSVVGLLAYPIVLESRLTLTQQNHLWYHGYVVLLLLTSLCALYFLRPFLAPTTGQISGVINGRGATSTGDEEISFTRRMRWIWWSFVPSSLLLGVTSYVATDIVSAPLFWVLPLAVYLLSFVFAFARPSWATHSLPLRIQSLLLFSAMGTIWLNATKPEWLILPVHLLAFMITAVICHGQLAKDRPNANLLTEYYFWIAFGGVLGGSFNALVAPLLFTGVLEYPLVMVAAAFARPFADATRQFKWSRALDWFLPAAAVAAVLSITLTLKRAQVLPAGNDRLLICGVAGLICLIFANRPARFGLGLSAITLVMLWYPNPAGEVLYADRSFFGAYRAMLDADGKKHLLFQGTTVHGVQSVDAATRLEPLSYYHRTSPVGQVLDSTSIIRGDSNIAVIGLGTGALACHGTSRQKFTFFEIDPMVEKIARDERLFTYLRDCPPKIDVVIGDARISLAKTPMRLFDLFILDAFSSDAIPIHLLTREALELYLSKTAEDGVLLFHISNRYMDLAPVLDRLAGHLRLVALLQNDFNVSPAQGQEGKSASRWVMLARNERALGPFLKDRRWRRLDGRLGGELWTDEFSDILGVINWK